jgi:hypothetical protein
MSERKIDAELLNNTEKGEKNEQDKRDEQKPTRYLIDEKSLIETFKQSHMLFALEHLRNGITKKEAFMQLLKHKFSKKGIKAGDIIKIFYDMRMIKKVTFTKGQESEEFYVLVRDFIIYKKPPVKMMEDMLINPKFPQHLSTEIKKDIEDIFKNLKDLDVKFDEYLEITNTPSINVLIDALSQNVIPLHDTEYLAKLNSEIGPEFEKALDMLTTKGLVKIIEDQKRKEKWAYIRYVYEIHQIYPEYIVESINKNMKNGNIPKELAIIALNELKLAYYELEIPADLEAKRNQIETWKKEIEALRKDQTKKNEKQIKKLQDAIKKTYQEIGDLAELVKFTNEIEEVNKKEL